MCVPLHMNQIAHQAGTYLGFCTMKQIGIFLLPPGSETNISKGSPALNSPLSFLFTWVKRGTERLKCLSQEHSAVFPARAEPRHLDPETSALTLQVTAPKK